MQSAQLIVISAPSGSGKTTIVRELLRRHPELLFSVSTTTRPKRRREVEGKDYYFLTRKDFEQKVKAGELVEWEEIYGDLYGTLRSEVERARQEDKPMLFDVDVKGGLKIKKQYPQATSIFIKPPSVEALRKRLAERKTESGDSLKKRLARVPMEMQLESEFDYIVVNDEVARAVEEVESIVGLK